MIDTVDCRVINKCQQKALSCEQQCKADEQESNGADQCDVSRCSQLKQECMFQHQDRGVCELFDRYVKAEQQPVWTPPASQWS